MSHSIPNMSMLGLALGTAVSDAGAEGASTYHVRIRRGQFVEVIVDVQGCQFVVRTDVALTLFFAPVIFLVL